VSGGRVLVAGASGLVGRAALAHFSAREGWEVVGLSRRRPDAAGDYLEADLRDRQSLVAALEGTDPFTHLVYAALYEKPDVVAGWRDPEQMAVNLGMLTNVLDVLDDTSPLLTSVVALQGGKAYGVHLGRVPVPAKERWARSDHQIFYWQQEDLLRERARLGGWRVAFLRPQRILGDAVASPLSIVMALGVFAAVVRELGEPLHFPGGGRYVNACTDSRLLAEAIEFCATHEHTSGEIYNVVNGDFVDWRDLWQTVATSFGMETGEDRPTSLADLMPLRADTWEALAARHSLRHRSIRETAGGVWQYADLVLGFGQASPEHNVMSPIKLVQAGFTSSLDTADSFAYWLTRLQEQKVLPR
jgi:nucleoside-diphosphate-sugar epimerase